MSRYLTILEVSGKQNYIFSSNKLKDNVHRSAEIAYMTSMEGIMGLTKGTGTFAEDNLVYAGGGHTVLEFPDEESAVSFGRVFSRRVHEYFPDADLFIRTVPYNDQLKPGENLEELTKALERKKSVRRASFHQGSFGIEKIQTDTLKPDRQGTAEQKAVRIEIDGHEREFSRALLPDGYTVSYKFENLGGSRGDSNFVAVVHIDGNGMGKRVQDFYERQKNLSWDAFRQKVCEFSTAIADDYTDAFREMNKKVGDAIQNGLLNDLDLQKEDDSETYFPVRRLITSGDDICFVCDGRIGISCARAFIEALAQKKNKADGEGYHACAGVAMVHAKYPFFRAYDLAESLCSNAKNFNALVSPADNGRNISSIDWHIEQGEIRKDLSDIKSQYVAHDGSRLDLRPYIVETSDKEVLKNNPFRQFFLFEQVLKVMKGSGRSSMKTMRPSLLEGEKAAEHYIRFHHLEDFIRECYLGIFEEQDLKKIGTGEGQNVRAYVPVYGKGQDKPVEHSILYDATEVMDVYLPLEGEDR